MLSAPSVTLRSRPAACTAIFSAKKRVNAMRAAPSPLSRKAASACSASMQPPAACRTSSNRASRPLAPCRSDFCASSQCVARSSTSTASARRTPPYHRKPARCWLSPPTPLRATRRDRARPPCRRRAAACASPGRWPGCRWCLRRSRRCGRRDNAGRRRSPRYSPCRRAPARRGRRPRCRCRWRTPWRPA